MMGIFHVYGIEKFSEMFQAANWITCLRYSVKQLCTFLTRSDRELQKRRSVLMGVNIRVPFFCTGFWPFSQCFLYESLPCSSSLRSSSHCSSRYLRNGFSGSRRLSPGRSFLSFTIDASRPSRRNVRRWRTCDGARSFACLLSRSRKSDSQVAQNCPNWAMGWFGLIRLIGMSVPGKWEGSCKETDMVLRRRGAKRKLQWRGRECDRVWKVDWYFRQSVRVILWNFLKSQGLF